MWSVFPACRVCILEEQSMQLRADGSILQRQGPHQSEAEALARSLIFLKPGVMDVAWCLLQQFYLLGVQCFSRRCYGHSGWAWSQCYKTGPLRTGRLAPLHAYMLSHSVMSDSLGPHYCSLWGSTIHEISQARILELVAISFCRKSSQSSDQTCVSCVSCTGRQVLYQTNHQESP